MILHKVLRDLRIGYSAYCLTSSIDVKQEDRSGDMLFL
jgi:hypothetical protein